MGLSSSGPSQTMAVSLAALVSASGYAGIIPILICFLPMMGIAVAYQRLNRWDQNSGATYTWVAKVFHPYLGFLAGWMILLYYTLGTTSLTIPAGIYTLELLAPARVNEPVAIFLAGSAWTIMISALALFGLRVVMRFEWLIVVFEYFVLILVAGIAVAALIDRRTAVAFEPHWLSWGSLGGMRGLMGGILIACFMYSGWDAAMYVSEETTDRARNPGRAAIASVAMLALMYAMCTFAFQGVLSGTDLQAHAGNALAAISSHLLPAPYDKAMALVVLGGTLASLQSAVVAAARMGKAMARDRVMPAYFAHTAADGSNPWAATLTMGALNLALLGLALHTSGIASALNNAASSLGLISIIFYGLTAAAAVWQQRGRIASSVADALLSGALPLLGVLFCLWVLCQSLYSGAVNRVTMYYGLGSIGLGLIVALVLHHIVGVSFFISSARKSTKP